MITLTREEAQKVEQYIKPYAIVPVDMQTTQLLVNALRAKLSEPEPEPVAWMEIENYLDEENLWCERKVLSEYDNGRNMPLYTAPPQREWVGLTDDKYEAMAEQYVTNCYFDTLKYAKAIEAKLKEKNG